jgi:antitoxin MazE
MIQTVKKWGNSPAIRLPLSVMAAAHFTLDQQVEIKVEQGRIIIEPLVQYDDLDMLLCGITDENLHAEVNMGFAQGKELL